MSCQLEAYRQETFYKKMRHLIDTGLQKTELCYKSVMLCSLLNV